MASDARERGKARPGLPTFAIPLLVEATHTVPEGALYMGP